MSQFPTTCIFDTSKILGYLHIRMEVVMFEIWKPVVGFESWYVVSSMGRVKRIAPGKGTYPGRILKLCKTNAGYLNVRLCAGRGRGTTQDVHRLVCAAFIGACPAGAEVNHKDGIKTNNQISNLEYVTRSVNLKHACSIGLSNYRGERNGNARLTERIVRLIRHDLAKGHLQRQIAVRYGIDQSTVSQIKTQKRWSHVS